MEAYIFVHNTFTMMNHDEQLSLPTAQHRTTQLLPLTSSIVLDRREAEVYASGLEVLSNPACKTCFLTLSASPKSRCKLLHLDGP